MRLPYLPFFLFLPVARCPAGSAVRKKPKNGRKGMTMGKPKMLGYFKPYKPNSRLDARYRRKMEVSRTVIDTKKQGGVNHEAKQSKA